MIERGYANEGLSAGSLLIPFFLKTYC